MYQGQLSSSAYRIKKKKVNNYVNDQRHTTQEDPYKISIHSSTQMSPNKRQRGISQGIKYRQNKLQRFSSRSKKSSKMMSNSGVSSTTKKTIKPQKIIQFDNVKWLSIISAYDPKQLKNVTTSQESYQKFLKNGNIRKDPYNKETFKVVIDHFKCWVARIRDSYFQILSKFLSQNTNTSAIVTLANVKPMLEQVKFQSSMMHNKVRTCQQTQNYRQFSSLLLKFDSFLEASHEIQEIIYIVNQSKNRIDDLFKNLEEDEQIDRKVNKERRRGIKKARNAVKDYGDDAIEGKILERVESAINQMANKTLQAFSKINGARGLMLRIQQCLSNRGDPHNLQNIITINQIFRQVIREADEYQKFAQHFMEQGDILNDDLKQCILRYRQQVEIKKQAVFEMQLQFISNILQVSIHTLQGNYSVCNTIQSNLSEEYKKIQNLLVSICQIISDETKKVHIDLMIKDNKQKFRKVEHLINKLKRFAGNAQAPIYLDFDSGLNQLVSLQDTIVSYKALIKTIVQRQQRTYKQITGKRVSGKQEFPQQDTEQQYIKNLIKLSKTMNQQQKQKQLATLISIQPLHKISMKQIHQQDLHKDNIKTIKWCLHIWQKYDELSSNNQLSNLLSNVQVHNNLYELSQLLLDIHKVSGNTKQKNIIPQIQAIKKFSGRVKEEICSNFYERCLYQVLYLGLEGKLVRTIQQTENLKFPQNQHDIQQIKRDIKYLKVIHEGMPIINNATQQIFICVTELGLVITALKQIIQGVLIFQNIKWNKQQKYYLPQQTIFKQSHQLFTTVFLTKSVESINSITGRICKLLRGYEKNLNKLKEEQKTSNNHPARIHHVCNIINNYFQINSRMLGDLQKLEEDGLGLDYLEMYAKIISYFCRYLHQTKQTCHLVLSNNHDKSPIWVSQPTSKTDNDLAELIGLKGLKKGQVVTEYDQKPCLAHNRRPPSAINKQPPNKEKNKKSKPKKDQIDDQMEEYIQDDDLDEEMADQMGDQVDDQMGDEMGDEIGDQMGDQMGDQVGDEMGDEMGDQMGDQVGDQMGDQVDDQMGDQMGDQVGDDEINDLDFDDEFIDDMKDSNRPKTIKKQSQKNSKLKSLQNSKKNQPSQSQQKPSQPQKQQQQSIKPEAQQYMSVKIVPKKHTITYQIFPSHIKTLQDLAQLVAKFQNLYALFWTRAQFHNIEHYFNRQYKGQINKEIMADLEEFCKENFSKDIIAAKAIHNLQGYQDIVASIHQIDHYKIQELNKILGASHKGRKYCELLGSKNQLLRISIEDNDQWKASRVVQQYLKKILKQISVEQQNFEMNKYKKQLIKQRKNNIQTIYKIPTATLQPETQKLKQKMGQTFNCCQKYADFTKFPDGLNLQEVIVAVWNNSCNPNHQIQLNIPQQLNSDRQMIKQAIDSDNFISYISTITIQAQIKLDKINQHYETLQNIFKNSHEQSSLLQHIKTLVQCYGYQNNTITLNNEPLIIQLSKPTTQFQKLLTALLIPKKQKTITGQQIVNNIKLHPEIYAENYMIIANIAHILGLQMHIWASETSLQIFDCKQDLISCIIHQVSCKCFKNLEELEESALKPINAALKTEEFRSLVWQYSIIQNSCLSYENNKSYLKMYQGLTKKYKQLLKLPMSIGLCIFESVIGISQQNSKVTLQVLEQLDEIENQLSTNELIKNKEGQISIFTYSQKYRLQIDKIKETLSNKRTSLETLVEPIQIDKNSQLKYLEQFKKKNEIVGELYQIYGQTQIKQLSLLKICLCGQKEQCSQEQQISLYMNKKNKGSLLEDMLAYLFSQPTQIYHNMFEKHMQTVSVGKTHKKTQILHSTKLLSELSHTLNKDTLSNMKIFMNQYNFKHFIDTNYSPAMQQYKKLSEILTNKQNILNLLQEFVSATNQNGLIQIQVLEQLKLGSLKKIMEKLKGLEDQLQLLHNIDMSAISKYGKYSSFGKWVLEVVGKLYKISTILLMDSQEPNVMVCIMPSLSQTELQEQLLRLKLPKQYEIIEKKKSFTKIKLKSQQIKFVIDQQIDLQEFKSFNFGLQSYNLPHTLYFTVYRYYRNQDNEKEQALVFYTQLSEQLKENNSIVLGISGQQICGDLDFRLIDVEVSNEQQNDNYNIQDDFQSIKISQKLKVYLGEEVKLQKINKWMKKELERLIQKKRKQEEAMFILQQKRLQEQEERKKRQEQQEQRRIQEEERKRKQQQEEQKRLEEEQQKRKQNEQAEKLKQNNQPDDQFDFDDNQGNQNKGNEPDQNSDQYVPH